MADLMSIVPTEDPFDSPFIENALRFWDDTNPKFDFEPPNLVQEQEPGPEPDSTNQQWVPESGYELENVVESENPSSMENLLFWDINGMIGEEDGNNNADQTGGIGTENINEFLNMEQESTNVIPLSVWPMAPVPFSCSFCQVLREVIHTNGTQTTKLEIHGRIGIFCHAILETRHNVDGLPSIQHQMIDFSNQNMESVKQYLVQYCQDRKRTGFFSLQDPLWTFYDTLCGGLDWDKNSSHTDEFSQPAKTQSVQGFVRAIIKQTTVLPGFPRAALQHREHFLPKNDIINRSNNSFYRIFSHSHTRIIFRYARERTGRLRLSDLADYFHLPIDVAAKKLEICPTVLKKICRKNGMKRWPYRKIKSVDRKISNLQQILREKDGEASAQAQAEIERLRQERAAVCMGTVK